jgi:hypothetical protein
MLATATSRRTNRRGLEQKESTALETWAGVHPRQNRRTIERTVQTGADPAQSVPPQGFSFVNGFNALHQTKWHASCSNQGNWESSHDH